MKVVLSGMLILLTMLMNGRPQTEEPQLEMLKEYVSVSNVELILRVMLDGKPLGGFNKEDFRLLENGKECHINGFFELKKRMKPDSGMQQESSKAAGRLFLLFFWATQGESEIKVHLDHFFKTVYSPRDRVLLVSNDHQVDIRSPDQVETGRTEFETRLKEEIDKKQAQWNSLHRDLSFEIDQMIRMVRLNRDAADVSGYLNAFTSKYAQFMKEIGYMTQNLGYSKIDQMAEDLKRIASTKWALIFFENTRVPMVDIISLKSEVENVIICDDDGLMISSWFKNLVGIEIGMAQVGAQFKVFETLRSRFIQSDTVFHYLAMDTASTAKANKADEDQLIAFKPIPSSWENILKTISRVSGGQVGSIKSDPTALDSLFELDDISYRITYVPMDNKKKKDRKIQMLLKKPRPGINSSNLIYGKHIEMDETPAVRIEGISHQQNTLNLNLVGYYPIITPMGPRGHLQLQVMGKTGPNDPIQLYSADVESSGLLEIPLKLDKVGVWDLYVSVTDAMTQLKDIKKYRMMHNVVTERPTDDHAADAGEAGLGTLLVKSAEYSERLKKAALHFFCTERVSEKIGTSIKTSRYKKWEYDYQIVLQDGKLSETRDLAKAKKKKKNGESDSLETLYKSHYSFFLPATFMALERQSDYIYTLLGTERLQSRKTKKISALPRKSGIGLPAGQLWIDESDGSVLQIRLDPKTIVGFQHRYKLAEQNRKTIDITDTHQYYKRFNGMQFPSSTLITEQQVYKDLPSGGAYTTNQYLAHRFESALYSVHYVYENFRFFDVQTNERITGWVED